MTDSEYEELKKKVCDLYAKWVEPLGLNWWKIDLEHFREEKCEDNVRGSGLVDFEVLFQCHADWRYGHACIACFYPTIKAIDDNELEYAVVHELMHVFLDEMRGETDEQHDHEERVATSLAKAFLWFRDSMIEDKQEGDKMEDKEEDIDQEDDPDQYDSDQFGILESTTTTDAPDGEVFVYKDATHAVCPTERL